MIIVNTIFTSINTKKALFKIILLFFCFFTTLSFSQLVEEEPNNSLTDSGVKTIGGNGHYYGKNHRFNAAWRAPVYDLDFYKIAAGSTGKIKIYLNFIHNLGTIRLYEGTNGYSVNHQVGYTDNSNIPIVHILDPTKYYTIVLGGLTQFKERDWRFGIVGLNDPAVKTGNAIEVNSNTVTLNGTLESEGRRPGTERGFVYAIENTGSNLTINDPKTTKVVVGSGLGNYSTNVTVIPGKRYVYRAYASNIDAIRYGEQKFFFILDNPSLPVTADFTNVNTDNDGKVLYNKGFKFTSLESFYRNNNQIQIAFQNYDNRNNRSVTIEKVDGTLFNFESFKYNKSTSSSTRVDFDSIKAFKNNVTIGVLKFEDINHANDVYSLTNDFKSVDKVVFYWPNEQNYQPTYFFDDFVMKEPLSLPAVNTVNTSNITPIAATLNGNVTSDGSGIISERGFVYSLSQTNVNPRIDSLGVVKVPVSGSTGSFNHQLSGLYANTYYYFNTYVINELGTVYGTPNYFVTGNSAPVFSSTPTTSIVENQEFEYSISISDANGGYPEVTAPNKPNWLQFSKATTISLVGSGTAGGINGIGTNATIANPNGVVKDSQGNLYITDGGNASIRKVDTNLNVTTFVGNGTIGNVNGTGNAATFGNPYGIAIDSNDNLYVSDWVNHNIRKITPSGVVTTLASGFNQPSGLAVDSSGNVFVADRGNHQIKKITPAGVVTVYAGSGVQAGLDGLGENAQFSFPVGLAIDNKGVLYVADQANNTIRLINPDRLVLSVAGSSTAGSTNANGLNATFNAPSGVAVDAAGNIYVADTGNNLIRKIVANRDVKTVVGISSAEYVDGYSYQATFKSPTGLFLDTTGNLYVIDNTGHKLRKVAFTPKLIGNVANNVGAHNITINAFDGFSDGETLQQFTLNVNAITVPTLTTTVNNITSSSITVGGNISSNGNATVTERGFVYATYDRTPEIGEKWVTKKVITSNNTIFSEALSDLDVNNTYYFRAYAINAIGTAYGNIKTATLKSSAPSVVTNDAINVTATTATLSGEVTDNGVSNVTDKGILYSATNANPKFPLSSGVSNGTANGPGTTITVNATNLDNTKVYYYRAYAKNNNGIRYGVVKRFTLNNALHFNGVENHLFANQNDEFDYSGGFTAEAWIKPEDLNNRTIFSHGSGNNKSFIATVLSNGKIQFTLDTNLGKHNTLESTRTISANTWYHVAFTYDELVMKIYINGVLAGTRNISGTMFQSNLELRIGSLSNTNYFKGTIDEVKFWGRDLSASEIVNGMFAKVPFNANGLLTYLDFNKGVANGSNVGISQLNYSNGSNQVRYYFSFHFSRTGTTSNFVNGVNGFEGQTNYAPNIFKTNGNWSNTNNWSHGQVPTTVQNATIKTGVNVTIDTDNLNINDFILEPGATITIPKDKEVTVNGAFLTEGNLELQSDKTTSGILYLNGITNGNVTYKRGGLLANKWSIVTPPVSGQTIKSFAENNANDIRRNTTVSPIRYAIAYYDDAQTAGNRWRYYDASVNAAEEFTAGQSYSISRATDGEVTFTGKLTTSNIVKTLIANQWNAIGNPFTTYYPANKNSSSSFLNDNLDALDDTFKSLYIWDNAQEKYVAVTEVDDANRSLPPGQGFFIRMKEGKTQVVFNEDKRSIKPISGNSNFEKQTPTPNIKLSISKDDITVDTHIKFFENATNGFDTGFDIGNFNSTNLDIYSHLVDGTKAKNFTIQSLPNTSLSDVSIPLGILAKKGDEISINATRSNIPEDINLYLEDRENNSFTKLDTNKPFYWAVEKNGKIEDRFYLHLSQKTLQTYSTVFSNVSVYSIDKTILIKNLNEEAAVTVFSTLGSKIYQGKIKANALNTLKMTSIPTGLYLVNLKTAKRSITKKIIIE